MPSKRGGAVRRLSTGEPQGKSLDRSNPVDERRLRKPGWACEYLGISRRTLWSLTNCGRIPHVRLSPRAVRYDLEDLRKFVEQCKRRGMQ